MSFAFFQAERSLALMTLLTQDGLEKIYQALKKHYALCHQSKLIVCFYDPRCFFLLRSIQEVSRNRKSEGHS